MITKKHSIVAVTVTPFVKDCVPNFSEIEKQTETLCRSGIDAIFPNASTGEFPRMETEDKLKIMKTVADAAAGRKALIAGACDGSEPGVIRYLEAAKKLGYDGAVVCPTYYYGLSQNDVFRFYRNVSEAAEGLPVIAYHVPFFTTGIEQDTFRRILDLPGICGMKDSSANLKRIAHLCDIAQRVRPEFEVYTGTDDCLLPALTVGCFGNMTALAASMPEKICGIYEAFRAGDLPLAMKRQREIQAVIRQADSLPFPLGYKVLAKARGLQTENWNDERVPAVYEEMLRLLGELK